MKASLDRAGKQTDTQVMTESRQPGDLIIDRHAPHLSAEERRVARERLTALARLVLEVATANLKRDIPKDDSTVPQPADTIPPTPLGV